MDKKYFERALEAAKNDDFFEFKKSIEPILKKELIDRIKDVVRDTRKNLFDIAAGGQDEF